ncbi:ligand-binding sensor domain-containing diguanylate cyclase [Luteimonas sp. MC1828]|uniref:ligand-binding sensor domain-containing protein n=1 Tax=Luteimonas sp. MC1828 TaxID=2799787 RepID=UPI0018F2503F|nr:ligand-binding sensor domain-containing diguanylate cyclase [Luteimonas sp. MC1828]MBJ7573927.1 diguanylate cyclase [Luteimonas sp. MC1828]
MPRPATSLSTNAIAGLLLLLCTWPALAAYTSTPQRLEAFGPDEGLPQSTVNALAGDDQGFLWVATQDGLARFDGHRFQSWRRERGNDLGLASSSIDALAFDRAATRLWLGTDDTGVEIIHLPSWERIRLDRGDGLSDDRTTAILVDPEGGAWIGTAGGLDHVGIAPRHVRKLGGGEIVGLAPLPQGGALALGRDCRLWHATREAMTALPRRGGDNGSACIALQSGPEGAWVASERGGLALVDAADGRLLRRYAISELQPDASVLTALLRRRDGSVLAGFGNGSVTRLAAAGATPAPLHLDRDLGNPVVTLYEGASGALWIGTYTSGLYFARPLSDVIRFGRSDAGRMEGWPSVSMRALWRAGEHLLAGTDNGLMERRTAGRDWTEVAGFEGQSVRAIARAEDRGWWIGTQDGLWHWPGTGAPRRIPGLPDPRIDAMLVEGGTVWVATRGGLARVSNGELVADPTLAPLAGRQVTALLRDRDGPLWIATNAAGLWRLDAGADAAPSEHTGLHHSLWSLTADDQALWVGSYSHGLYRIDRDSGAIRNYSDRDGLGNNVVYAILGDSVGRLWLSTNNGLSVLAPGEDSIQVLGPRDGLQNREYNSGSAFRDQDGLLYFGGTRGLDVLDPDKLPLQSPAARAVLTTLSLSPGESNGDESGPVESDIVYADSVSLAWRDRVFSIAMTSIDFGAAEVAQLRYRMRGLHEAWVYPRAPRAEFSVSRLPPGDYVLEVEAAGRDGRYGDTRRLDLHMAPPWWRHPFAYAGYVLAALLLAALVARRAGSAVRRERRQVELLERTVAERTAQLQEANLRLSTTNAQLDIATRRDPLTRISNRRDLQDWLGREAGALRTAIEQAGGPLERLVFFMIDIDDFKQVNDRHGHQAGDEVLVHFADRLRLLSRDHDLLVRWGGEEFLLITRFTRVADAAQLAERIREAIAGQPIRVAPGLVLPLTCSIGFAPWPFAPECPDVGDWEACVGLADRCLYAAKRGTKDAWVGVVPGPHPDRTGVQALLAGAAPADVGEDCARVLHSGTVAPGFTR